MYEQPLQVLIITDDKIWCDIPDDWKLVCWIHCYVLNKIWFHWTCEGDYDILRKTTKNNNVIKWGFHRMS